MLKQPGEGTFLSSSVHEALRWECFGQLDSKLCSMLTLYVAVFVHSLMQKYITLFVQFHTLNYSEGMIKKQVDLILLLDANNSCWCFTFRDCILHTT